ncbi:hypothetical protein ACH5RR_032444 [Cinchona calisaya]|uniref:Uncharacterized protein n=1 Tax=Cinchona calisaya TaxID=153742 RepID=A0ABD2YMI5_9GENT
MEGGDMSGDSGQELDSFNTAKVHNSIQIDGMAMKAEKVEVLYNGKSKDQDMQEAFYQTSAMSSRFGVIVLVTILILDQVQLQRRNHSTYLRKRKHLLVESNLVQKILQNCFNRRKHKKKCASMRYKWSCSEFLRAILPHVYLCYYFLSLTLCMCRFWLVYVGFGLSVTLFTVTLILYHAIG